MTSKTKNFNLDVNDMFATKDTQQTEPQQDTRSQKKLRDQRRSIIQQKE